MRLLRQATGGGAGRGSLRRGGPVTTVAVDALGADLGAGEVAAGALDATRNGASCLIYGPRAAIEQGLGGRASELIEIVDAPLAITNEEEPARAVRAKEDASVVQATKALAAGRAEAMVSAGATGAALAASLLHVKRIPGVVRPAIAVPLPLPAGTVVLLDAGANVEVRPEHLVQFAFMGAAFSAAVLGVERPRVGLLSVGEEPGKGTPAVAAAHERLAVASGLDFAGNVEGNDVPEARVDVVVTDGFTGNVGLKLMEGTSRALSGAMRRAARSGPLAMLGGLLLRSRLGALRRQLDPERVGGAYLLGLRGLVVICHGRSTRRAIANAIELARKGAEEDVVSRTATALEASGALRGTGDAGQEADAASVSADSLTGGR